MSWTGGGTTQVEGSEFIQWNFCGILTHQVLENFHDVIERLRPLLEFEIKQNYTNVSEDISLES